MNDCKYAIRACYITKATKPATTGCALKDPH